MNLKEEIKINSTTLNIDSLVYTLAIGNKLGRHTYQFSDDLLRDLEKYPEEQVIKAYEKQLQRMRELRKEFDETCDLFWINRLNLLIKKEGE